MSISKKLHPSQSGCRAVRFASTAGNFAGFGADEIKDVRNPAVGGTGQTADGGEFLQVDTEVVEKLVGHVKEKNFADDHRTAEGAGTDGDHLD